MAVFNILNYKLKCINMGYVRITYDSTTEKHYIDYILFDLAMVLSFVHQCYIKLAFDHEQSWKQRRVRCEIEVVFYSR